MRADRGSEGVRDLGEGEAGVLRRLLESRHSCRHFLPRPVEREIIEQILAVSQRSASWCNTQPWQLHITEGAGTDALRAGLTQFAAADEGKPDLTFPERYAGVYYDRRRTCALQLYEQVGVERGDRAASAAQTWKNFELFDAPHVAILTTERDLGVYGVLDCGLYIQAFILAAQSLGVATIAQAALALCSPFLREHLDLPENREVVCGISFGYEDLEHHANEFRTERAPVSDVAHWVTS
jgi:nitroreductase